MSPPRVIVFVKAPRPGRVKTRLAATIGPEAACAAYREMVDTLLDNLTPLPHLELRYTPDNAFNEIRPWLRNQWSTAPQGLGDLGERMHRAFTEAGGPAILIGSDCPEITALDINEAATALKTHNGAIGPAEDGGYWLIGLQLPCPALFNDMCWSTGDVLKQSLARANKANLSLHHLRKLKDVDESNDWKNWKNSRSKYPK